MTLDLPNFCIHVTFADLSFRVEGNWTAGDPGQTSGPPERCYPPEPESLDDVVITLIGAEGAEIDVTELAYTVIVGGPWASTERLTTLGQLLEERALRLAAEARRDECED